MLKNKNLYIGELQFLPSEQFLGRVELDCHLPQ